MEIEKLNFKDKEHAEAFIGRMEAAIASEQDEKFHITSESKADWVIKKITAVDDEIDRLEEQHRRRVKQLENEKTFFEERFSRELEAFVKANLDGRKKSIDFPHGRAGFRKSRETIEIVDKDRNLEWAKKNCPNAVRKREYTTKTEQVKHLKETGELPVGCELKPSQNRFFVK